LETEEQIQTSAEQCASVLLDTLPPLMRMLHGALRRHAGTDEDPPNFGQIRMLEMLQAQPWKLTDLATRHHVAASTMSRTVDLLVKRGWVARQSAAHDRRQVILVLTEAGQRAQQAFAEQSRAVVSELMERLDQHERVRLIDGLAVLQQLFDHGPDCVPTHTEREQ
jgi:DNA-binding MarR family transcriptional regulator